jgi:hypothetical protein
MFKDILELIITIIIISYVWNILKKVFFNSVTKNFQQRYPQNNTATQNPQEPKINQKVHWDAETVDYEEIKEPNDKSN